MNSSNDNMKNWPTYTKCQQWPVMFSSCLFWLHFWSKSACESIGSSGWVNLVDGRNWLEKLADCTKNFKQLTTVNNKQQLATTGNNRQQLTNMTNFLPNMPEHLQPLATKPTRRNRPQGQGKFCQIFIGDRRTKGVSTYKKAPQEGNISHCKLKDTRVWIPIVFVLQWDHCVDTETSFCLNVGNLK
jgi:hypothetical protein